MAVRRRTRASSYYHRPLTWSPPTLSSPRLVTVTDDPATRKITLNSGEDLLLSMPTKISTLTDDMGTRDALVHVIGGRHVTLIGGHISPAATPTTSVTVAVGTSETTLTVASAAEFPSTGALRVDGEMIFYTGKTGTTFTGLTRDAGFYNSGALSSKTHAVGAVVYIAEAGRQALAFENQSGTVHVEGVLMDGNLTDGVRISGSAGQITQIQNCRIGPVVNADYIGATDGHPDCIQIIRGPDEIRCDRLTLMARTGRCFLNQGSANAQPMLRGIMRDVELVGSGTQVELMSNFDASTVWTLQNVWALPQGGVLSSDGRLTPFMAIGSYGQPAADYCPATVAGLSYVSPGYIT